MRTLDAGDRPLLRTWTTETQRAGEVVDAWSDTLSRNFLSWTLAERPTAPFTARVNAADVDGLRLIHCHCDSNRGFRKRAEIARTDRGYFGILCVLSGREVITLRDRQIVLETGNFLVWDSEEPMEYALLGPLEKATIVAPADLVLSAIPHARRLVGRPFNRAPGVESVFFEYVKGMVGAMRQMDADELRGVLGISLDMLARTTWGALGDRGDARSVALLHAQKFIASRLHDVSLDPAQIASACGISVRTLHGLFSSAGHSVCDWIRSRRLERCREELVAPRFARCTIAEIALRWGFSDTTHFARAFRNTYGCSPSEFRQRHLGAAERVRGSALRSSPPP
jgi:AraC-like DNA-binding protein